MILEFNNPLKPEQKEYLKEDNDQWDSMGAKLIPLTDEQKKVSKTNANYYFTRPDNDNQFFCHFNQDTRIFCLAETVSKDQHDVWLKDKKSITFYDGNIVLRDNNNNTAAPFQNIEKISEIINSDYKNLDTKNVQDKGISTMPVAEELQTKNIEFKPLQFVLDQVKNLREKVINKPSNENKNNMK